MTNTPADIKRCISLMSSSDRKQYGLLFESAPIMLAALKAIVKITDGSQPIDYPSVLMVARSALNTP